MRKFVISSDEERFDQPFFNSKQEAIEEGKVEYDGEMFWVGEAVNPVSPENLFSVEDWLETVSCHENYDCEWSEGWDLSTKEQRKELEQEVQQVMSKWLDKYDLRPKFFNVIDVECVRHWIEEEEKGGGK